MTTDRSTAPVVDPAGRRLLRIEIRNAQTPIEQKPEWIKTRARTGPNFLGLDELVRSRVCTRCVRRPIVPTSSSAGRTARRRSSSAATTITGVGRDDLPDGGAWLYAETVRQTHELNPDTGVENLIPDFNGKRDLLAEVFESRPEILAHNVETVPRIFKRIRPAFRYDRSLDELTQARDFGLVTKSNLILGVGETREEVSQALRDLHAAGCDLITITQYLRPSARHHSRGAMGRALGVRRAPTRGPRRSASPAPSPARSSVPRTRLVAFTPRR